MQVRRGAAASATLKPVKQAELETLLASKDEVGTDCPDGEFFARALPREKWSQDAPDVVERVVLVHRLREVIAQVGFRWFEAIAPDVDGELDVGVTRAALAQEMKWLPAVENRGEGVFIGSHGRSSKPGRRSRRCRSEASSSCAASMPGRQSTQGASGSSSACPHFSCPMTVSYRRTLVRFGMSTKSGQAQTDSSSALVSELCTA
jgi:hypothetical protein